MKRKPKRLIRWGDLFTEDEIADDCDAELMIVQPVVNPGDYEQNEPWAADRGDA